MESERVELWMTLERVGIFIYLGRPLMQMTEDQAECRVCGGMVEVEGRLDNRGLTLRCMECGSEVEGTHPEPVRILRG